MNRTKNAARNMVFGLLLNIYKIWIPFVVRTVMIWKLGEEKTALFAIIPDNDTSFNFLVSILYTQLFQQLFEVADKKYGEPLF